jgi:hypothetical protein
MHKITKITLFLGALLALTSIVGMFIAGNSLNMASPDSEDWSGALLWEGDTPSTFVDDFKWSAIYNVWVEIGSEEDIEIEVYSYEDGTQDKSYRFVSCSELNDCGIYDLDGKIDGFVYIGEIVFDDSGTYEISITESNGENVGIQIRGESIIGAFGILGSFVGCCVAFIVLSIGIILSFIKKEKGELRPKQVIIVGREKSKVIPELVNADEETKLEWWEDGS